MPEDLNGRKIFTLLEVTKSIQKMFTQHFTASYWIKAEMNKLGLYAQTGHCFPELVEKKEEKIIARIDALLWKTDYDNINGNFKRVLNDELKDGIKILLLGKVEYSPEYGLKLRIIDIDPSYTLGDFERERLETIKKLKEEGLYDKNRTLKFPVLPKRIAIISDHDSRGYQDFVNVIQGARDTWGYNFFHMLFPAALQGDKAIASIPLQLNRIRKVKHHFDVVAIIRGGGGELSFACYNNYKLSKAIADFPLPMVTGIGHVTNTTVVDMISHQSAITPTKLAEFLIQKFHNFSVPVRDAETKIIDRSRRLIADENTRFQTEIKLFRSVTANVLLLNNNTLKENSQSLSQQSQFIFKREREYLSGIRQEITKDALLYCNSSKQKLVQFAQSIKKDTVASLKQLFMLVDQKRQQLETGSGIILKTNSAELQNIEKNIDNMSPSKVIKRGYSITLLNGRSVRSPSDIKKGDILSTLIHEGEILSTVNSTTNTAE